MHSNLRTLDEEVSNKDHGKHKSDILVMVLFGFVS